MSNGMGVDEVVSNGMGVDEVVSNGMGVDEVVSNGMGVNEVVSNGDGCEEICNDDTARTFISSSVQSFGDMLHTGTCANAALLITFVNCSQLKRGVDK